MRPLAFAVAIAVGLVFATRGGAATTLATAGRTEQRAAARSSAAPRAAPFKAVLRAGTQTPKIKVKWWWELRVTDRRGKAIRATLTLQIVDPFGGVHPVEFGDTKRNIVNFAFVGRFRDFIRFPPESKGFQLTLRYTVKAKGARVILKYTVTPRS